MSLPWDRLTRAMITTWSSKVAKSFIVICFLKYAQYPASMFYFCYKKQRNSNLYIIMFFPIKTWYKRDNTLAVSSLNAFEKCPLIHCLFVVQSVGKRRRTFAFSLSWILPTNSFFIFFIYFRNKKHTLWVCSVWSIIVEKVWFIK